jgi:hypothetical protein
MYLRYVKQLGRRFRNFSQNETAVSGGVARQWGGENVRAEAKEALMLNDQFERLKEQGHGYFTYDENGKLAGVAVKPPNVLVPTDNKVG